MQIKLTTAQPKKETVLCVFGKAAAPRFTEYEDGAELLIPVHNPERVVLRSFRTLIRKALRAARQHQVDSLALDSGSFEEFPQLAGTPQEALIRITIEEALIAHFEFERFKTAKNGWGGISSFSLIAPKSKKNETALQEAITTASCVNACRELANMPAGDMTPKILAKEARKALAGTKVHMTVLGRAAMEKLGMGAILGVSRGSTEEPQFIVMEYWGAGKSKGKPLVLAGKGVTFDTGGINIKPTSGLLGMHLDMTGGAVVIHALALIAKLKLPINVIGLVPAVENMTSGSSYRPGDILKSLSGKTIEILNTDAEGRVILADALTYAARYKPHTVIDVATLTGSSLVALGQHASALMTRDEELEREIREAGEAAGEYVWPLPLWDEYEEYVRGIHGDLANAPSRGNQRYADAIHGGTFLYQFAKAYRWAHLDIAPRMKNAPSEPLANGATGEPVRLLAQLAKTYANR